MFGDGLSRRGAVLEQSYAYESDQRLIRTGREGLDRQSDFEQIRDATHITDVKVLTELIDCGVRANSLHILTIVPLVHVAWSNGHVERVERLAIMNAAEQEGIRADSPGYALLNGWLRCRPHGSLIRTWKDYVAAVRLFVTPEAYAALHSSTVTRARIVAEAAGGIMGFNKVSRAEEAAIQELHQAFI